MVYLGKVSAEAARAARDNDHLTLEVVAHGVRAYAWKMNLFKKLPILWFGPPDFASYFPPSPQ